MDKIKISPKGFTLIELLVVVLIIGVLTAVALPAYRKAVEKSRVTDALNTMQAVAKSEHGWYLMNNEYTKDFANLDIALIDMDGKKADGESFNSVNYTYKLLDSGILVTKDSGEYSLYKDYNTNQILCTPGTHYICEDLGAFTKEPCENANMAWANRNSTCYADEEERCYGLNPGVDSIWHEDDPENNWCGYTNTDSKTLSDGMKCEATGYKTCQESIINSGGVCEARARYACIDSIVNAGGVCKAYDSIGNGFGSCTNVIVYDGGECRGEDGSNQSCRGAIINEGARCVGSDGARLACDHVDINGGICEGDDACREAEVHNNGVCKGSCSQATVYDGGVCSGTCSGATVNNGGVCSGVCYGVKINDGGICSGSNCRGTIYAGGKCISNATNGCKYNPYPTDSETGLNGCCEGNNCGNAPKCNCKNSDGSYATSC